MLTTPIEKFLGWLGWTFPSGYVQGGLERTYSAFTVTFFITVLTLLFQYNALRRDRPIRWNSAVRPQLQNTVDRS